MMPKHSSWGAPWTGQVRRAILVLLASLALTTSLPDAALAAPGGSASGTKSRTVYNPPYAQPASTGTYCARFGFVPEYTTCTATATADSSSGVIKTVNKIDQTSDAATSGGESHSYGQMEFSYTVRKRMSSLPVRAEVFVNRASGSWKVDPLVAPKPGETAGTSALADLFIDAMDAGDAGSCALQKPPSDFPPTGQKTCQRPAAVNLMTIDEPNEASVVEGRSIEVSANLTGPGGAAIPPGTTIVFKVGIQSLAYMSKPGDMSLDVDAKVASVTIG